MKLADALLRRKELQEKVDQLRTVKESDLTQTIFQRKAVTDNVDEIYARVSKVEIKEVTKEFDVYAGRLRRIDAAIQRTNWNTDIEVDTDVWENT